MKHVLLSCASFVLSVAILFAADAALAGPRTPPSLPPPTKNVYEILAAQKDLGKFTEMVDDADLKKLLATTPATVFAPNDEAMDDIPRSTMKRIEASKASLESFVKYHIVLNNIVSSNAIRGRRITAASANGELLAFDGLRKKGVPMVDDATLVGSDLKATNGVVHVVSTPLLPPSLKGEAAEEPIAAPAAPAQPKTAQPAAPSPPVAPVTTEVPAVPETSAPLSPAGAADTTATGATTTGAPNMNTTTTGAVPEVPPNSPLQPGTSKPVENGSSGKGFSLFGHKFGW